MTLLVNKSGAGGNVIRNYTVLPTHSVNAIAATGNVKYTKGSILINDATDSMFFSFSISNFNGHLSSVIYGMLGKEFDVDIVDFSSGGNVGFTITNNEAATLTITLIQEL